MIQTFIELAVLNQIVRVFEAVPGEILTIQIEAVAQKTD